MSIGPSTPIGTAAGSPLAQRKGTDTDLAAQETSAQQRKVRTDLQSQQAAGIGEMSHETEVADRDADGRRAWEYGQHDPSQETTDTPPRSKDPSGQSGNRIDLSG